MVSDLNNISRETIEKKRIAAKISAKQIKEQRKDSLAPFQLPCLSLIIFKITFISFDSIVKSAPKLTYAHTQFVFFRAFWYNINN